MMKKAAILILQNVQHRPEPIIQVVDERRASVDNELAKV